MMGRQVGRLMLAAVLSLSGSAFGQASDPQAEAAARALFQAADEEMEAGDYAHACPRFEEVKRLVPEHVNTGIKLAECYLSVGRTASAWTEFSRVRSVAAAQRKTEKVEHIDDRLKEVLPRVPQMRVDVPAEVASIPGISVRRNGVELGAGQWGLALPVDPGTYELEATAPGRKAWAQTLEVAEKKAADALPVVVTIGGLAVEDEVVSKPMEGEVPRPAPLAPAAAGSSGTRIAGYVGLGLGVAGIGVGAILGGMAIARNGESNDGHCLANDHCDPTGYDLRTQAVTLGNASTAAVVAGGVLGVVGVVLLAVSPGASERKERDAGLGKTRVVVGPSGIGLRGAW